MTSDQVFRSQILYRGLHIQHIYYRAKFECSSFSSLANTGGLKGRLRYYKRRKRPGGIGLNQPAVTWQSHSQVRHSDESVVAGICHAARIRFSPFASRSLKIYATCRANWDTPGRHLLTGTSALLPNLPHIGGIYGQLVDFGHCSHKFWPQSPA